MSQIAATHLTGTPGAYLKLVDQTDTDLFWSKLKSYHANKYLMFASSIGTGDRTIAKDGIVQGHTYSLISVHEFAQNKIRLLKLRNPWGHQEWNGDWSDKSDLWTPHLIEEVELTGKDDGVFWISLGDFLKRFESAAFSAYSANSYKSNVEHTFVKSRTVCYRFNLNQDNDDLLANPFALSVFKQGSILQSHSDSKSKDQKGSEFAVILLKEEGKLVGEKTHMCDQAPSLLLMNEKLASGNYIVIVDATFSQSAEKDPTQRKIVLEVTGPEELKLQEIDESIALDCLHKAFSGIARDSELVDRKYHRATNPDYGQATFLVQSLCGAY